MIRFPSAILRRFRLLLAGFAELSPRQIRFECAAVYAAHNPKWHDVMELMLMSIVEDVLMIHFYRAEL